MEGEYFVFGLWRLYIAFGYKIFRSIISVISKKKVKRRGISRVIFFETKETLCCLALTELLGS